MTTKYKIYIVIAAVIAIAFLTAHFVAGHRLSKLERSVEMHKQRVDAAEQRADELQTAAARYDEKIAYLEQQLATLDTKRKEQDEKLTQARTLTRNARRNYADVRNTLVERSDTAELCQRLARVGHPCE